MKTKIQFVLSLLFGLLFMNGGLNKIFNYIPVPEDMPASMLDLMANLMAFGWLMPLIAWVEIIGGILFILPKTRAFGAVVLFPIQIGILLTHLNQAPDGLPMAIILLAIHLWVIIDNRAKYLPMLKA